MRLETIGKPKIIGKIRKIKHVSKYGNKFYPSRLTPGLFIFFPFESLP